MQAIGPTEYVARGIDSLSQLRELINLGRLDPGMTCIKVIDILSAVVIPKLPPHVKSLYLGCVSLDRGVSFEEGLESICLHQVSTVDSLDAWHFPASLVEMEIDALVFSAPDHRHSPTSPVNKVVEAALDLRGSKLEYLSLDRSDVPGDKILFPETLKELLMSNFEGRTLPRLTLSLERLSLIYCDSITDYSGAIGSKVTYLETETPPALYEYFPNLETAVFNRASDPFPEISLTHLKSLTFEDCTIEGVVEINAPNLETLVLRNSDPFDMIGCFAESVTTLELTDCDEFPESDRWFSLTKLVIKTSAINLDDQVIEVPHLPWLKWLTVEGQARANGVMVSNLREYKAAWGVQKRAKGAQRL